MCFYDSDLFTNQLNKIEFSKFPEIPAQNKKFPGIPTGEFLGYRISWNSREFPNGTGIPGVPDCRKQQSGRSHVLPCIDASIVAQTLLRTRQKWQLVINVKNGKLI